jgi:hypothetical protein
MMLLFPALSPQHFFASSSWKRNFVQKCHEILYISQYEIAQNKHENFAKYEMNYFAEFRFAKFHGPP